MSTALAIGLAIVVWLYTIIVMQNGGGPVSALAICGTAALAVIATVHFFITGQLVWCWAISGAILAAFGVAIFGKSELVN